MMTTALRRAHVLAVLAVTLGACTDHDEIVAPDLDPPSFAKASGMPQIAFGSDDALELYLVNDDGSDYSQVKKAGAAVQPAWSPDRKRIAFVNPSLTDPALYVMNAGGGKPVRLFSGSVRGPRWSPDGSAIAFSYSPSGNERYIFVIQADGTGLRRLTPLGTQVYDWNPTWSPDGQRIAFQSNRQGPNGEPQWSNLWVVDAAGTQMTLITDCRTADVICGAPTWSPVHERIAFTIKSRSSMDRGIAIVDPDGGNWETVMVRSDHVFDLLPAWSPDGTRFAFRSAMSGNSELYVMNTDGSNVVRLTFTAMRETSPAWAR